MGSLVLHVNSKWKVLVGCTACNKKTIVQVLAKLLDAKETEENSILPNPQKTESAII